MSTFPKLSSTMANMPTINPEALQVDQALQLMKAFVQERTQSLATEHVPLPQALGRVLAKDLISPINVPAADNSAMDGYAFNSSSLTNTSSQEKTLSISLHQVGIALAGQPFVDNVAIGACVRIMTGAIMPPGCDTAIAQELVQVNGDVITFPNHSVKAGDNRRLKGEDLTAGKPAILGGKVIRPADLGLIASLGIAQLEVHKKLRVGFFSTGTELRSLGETLDPGCIYDSNRYTIFGMLSRLGFELIDFGVVPDQPEALRATLHQAIIECDAIITSGGVSVGEADHTKQIMQEMGDISFWKLAIRPGRPMAFGSVSSVNDQAVLFGLPGNPVATMVTFYQLVRPTLLTMAGASQTAPLTTQARANQAIRKLPGRTEFQRGSLSIAPDGMTTVTPLPSQGSGVLSSMSQADCFIVLRHEQASVETGELVDVLVLEGLI